VQGLELATRIADIIVDGHGEDILILDLQQVTTITDFFVICTAASTRQLDALQNAIQTAAKQWGTSLVGGRKEGTPDSGWVLMDYNSVVIHLFSPEMRAYYQLEDLWKDARVVTRIQ